MFELFACSQNVFDICLMITVVRPHEGPYTQNEVTSQNLWPDLSCYLNKNESAGL